MIVDDGTLTESNPLPDCKRQQSDVIKLLASIIHHNIGQNPQYPMANYHRISISSINSCIDRSFGIDAFGYQQRFETILLLGSIW